MGGGGGVCCGAELQWARRGSGVVCRGVEDGQEAEAPVSGTLAGLLTLLEGVRLSARELTDPGREGAKGRGGKRAEAQRACVPSERGALVAALNAFPRRGAVSVLCFRGRRGVVELVSVVVSRRPRLFVRRGRSRVLVVGGVVALVLVGLVDLDAC